MKKIGLLYSYQTIDKLSGRQAILEFLKGPDNIGNLVYLRLLKENFECIEFVSAQELIQNPKAVGEKYETILLPFSNMLSEYFSSAVIAPIIENKIDVTLFSIGIQARIDADVSNISLSLDALSLLHYVNSTGRLIGVRGEYSRRLLDKYLINCVIVGCPTFSAVKPFRFDLRGRDNLRVVVSSTLSGNHRSETSDVISFGIKNNFDYALQDEHRIIADINNVSKDQIDFGSPSSDYALTFDNLMFDYGYYNNGEFDWMRHRSWFKSNAFFETDFYSWIEKVKKYDLSIGMRIHGNALALLNEVPALFIPCDLRSLELCDYHDLPSIKNLNSNTSIEQILDLTNYDKFFKKQPYVQEVLYSFWKQVGLDIYLKREINGDTKEEHQKL